MQGKNHGFPIVSKPLPDRLIFTNNKLFRDLKAASSMINLRDLRLDDARALLEQDPLSQLVGPDASSTVYVQSIIDNLCELSLKDPLTGLSNRRHFYNVLSREIDNATRSGDSALLLMLDIDKFKIVNDTHGHLAGDLVLRAVANCLATCMRPMDTVARYGGEEFAAIFPNCPASFGEVIAERIRETVSNLRTPVSALNSAQVTVSIGGAYAPEWAHSTAALWVDRADIQLYRAKSEGRNRVYIDQHREISVSAEEKSMLFNHRLIGDPAGAKTASSSVSGHATDSHKNKVNSP